MMLEALDIKKSFGELEVLKGVSIGVEKGDVAAILGPSGSGKTTFLRCINFLERASSGTLIFDGETFDLANITKKQIAEIRRKTAFVFQNYNLFRNKTVLQNVTEGLIVARKVPKAEAREKAMDALRRVGMAEKADSYPHELSGGQQQRVAIARALAKNPKLLLCDEPTGALDYVTGKSILALLHSACRERGMTVVVITHNSAITPMADRIIRVHSGSIASVELNPDPKPVEEIEW